MFMGIAPDETPDMPAIADEEGRRGVVSIPEYFEYPEVGRDVSGCPSTVLRYHALFLTFLML